MKKALLVLLFMASFSGWVSAQNPGELDLTFNASGVNFGDGANGGISTTSLQPDGKLIIGGSFTSYNGIERNRIARLNLDGTLDTGFNPGTGANSTIRTISLQSDGKLIIGGDFTSYNGTARNYIARLNPDGTLDTGFNPGTGADGTITTTSFQPDGKLIIGGVFTSYNGTARNRIARLNPDGTLDTGFNLGTGANNNILTTAIQPDGKLIIGGVFTSYNGTARNRIARLNPDGTLDTGFNPGTAANGAIWTLSLQPDGKIIIGGYFDSYNGTAITRIARLNSDGSLDTSFNPGIGPDFEILTTAFQLDGKIIIGGQFNSYSGTARNYIARLNPEGSLDTGFNPETGANGSIYTTAFQPDGKLIIGGFFTSYNGTARNRIARLNPDGTLDAGFNPGTGANNEILTTAIQSDGKLIIGGSFTSYDGTARNRIARLNPDGTLDTGFNPGTGANGAIWTTSLQPDGKLIIGGEFTSYNGTARNRIARLNPDGTLDTGFNPGTGADGTIRTISLQPDGKLIIGGDFTSYNGTTRNRIARLNPDGTLDTGFNPGTGANWFILTTAIQPDGKIIIGGEFATYNGTGRNYIARLNPDGSLDTEFNPGTGANSIIWTTSLQPDGKIIIGGNFSSYNGTARNRIARLNTDGTLDTGFNPGTGATNTIRTISLQPDGKLIIGGDFTGFNNISRVRIARIYGDPLEEKDTEAPVPNVESLTAFTAQCLVNFSDLTIPTATDKVDGTVQGTTNQDIFPITQQGSYTITWIFRDTEGNESSQTQEIVITGTSQGLGEVDCSFQIRDLSQFSEQFGVSSARGSSGLIDSQGRIYIGGTFNRKGETVVGNILRYLPDGSVDPNFSATTNSQVYVIKQQKDGKLLLGGSFTEVNGKPMNRLVRLLESGEIDPSFTIGEGFDTDMARNIVIQPDGKLILVGGFNSFNGQSVNKILRLNADGSLDNSFLPEIPFYGTPVGLILQADGKIIFSARDEDISGPQTKLIRLNPNGSIDQTLFTTVTGSVWDGVIQDDGKLVLVGISDINGTQTNGIVRINPDGSLDTSFQTGAGFGTGLIRTVYSRKDRGMFVGGAFTTYQGQSAPGIVAINADGSIDTRYNFGTGGNGANVNIQGILQQNDGKLIVVGWFSKFNGEIQTGATRLFGELGEVPPPVKTPPTAPTNLIASVADGLADISFTQESDGGSPILNYEYSLDGGTWTSFESSPLMLKGLVNGQEYSLSIKAVNAIGKSPESQLLKFTPSADCFAGQYWTASAATEANSWSSITYGNGKFVAVSRDGQNQVMTSTDGMSWTASPAAESNFWNSVTFGNGRFVAIATSGTNRVMSSTDGINWTLGSGTDINNSPWRSVTYGNGRFVAVASGGTNRIMSSTDGINWTVHQAPEENPWWSVTYGNGKFVAVGSTGTNRVIVSSDGINWTAHKAAAEGFWYAITYGNGKFVAIPFDKPILMSSTDGMNWTSFQLKESITWNSIAYGLGRFVAVSQIGDGGLTRVMSSPDGENWTTYKATEPNNWFTVGYGAGKFIALSFNGTNRVMVSSCETTSKEEVPTAPTNLIASVADGLADISFTQGSDGGTPILNYEYSLNGGTWTSFQASPLMLKGLVNGQEYSLSIKAVNAIGKSPESELIKFTPSADCFAGQYWTAYAAPGTNAWRSVTYGNGKFVAVSEPGAGVNQVMSSVDGINWTASPATEKIVWQSVTFGNGRFVAVAFLGVGNRVMTSTDGINWTSGTGTGINDPSWRSVTYGNGRFVAVAQSGANRIMSSTDGINWTLHQAPQVNTWQSVTYGNGKFVAVGNNSVMISPDGVNWTSQQPAANSYWFSVTYGNGKFVAVSVSGETKMMTSPDGINWTAQEVPVSINWNTVSYGLGRFVVVSISSSDNGLTKVMSSPDGENWTTHKAAEANNWYTLTYGGGKFVALSNNGTNRVMVSDCSIPPAELKAPEIVLVYPSDSQLEIEFKPPYDGVIPIINYEYSLDGGITWTSFNKSSPITITGLINDVEYNLSLRAVNSEGPGPGSIPMKVKPESCFPGKVWESKTAVGNSDWTSVIYAKGRFVAVSDYEYGEKIAAMTSTDGYTWTASQAPLEGWSSVTFGKDKFVAVAYDGPNRVMSSPDGVSWTAHQAVESNFWNSVTFGQDKFVAVAASGTFRVMTSEDGVTWTGHQAPQFAWRSVTYDGKGRFVAVGENSIMSSTDGMNWTLHTSPENNKWYSVTYGNGKFVAVAQNGTKRVMTSLDGISWTAHEGNATNIWTSVNYGGGRFVAVSSSWNVMSSEDGIAWVYPRSIPRNQWYAVTYGDNKFVALSWLSASGGKQVIVSECTPPTSAPTNLIATAGDTEIEVSFTPVAAESSPISNYEYSLDEGKTWIAFDPKTTTSPVTIGKLENGKEYTIILRAVNENGAGTASESVSGTPQRQITAPSIAIGEIESQIYTGVAISPDLTLTDGYTPMIEGVDYTLNYSDNLGVGTATITINGIGKYTGTTSKTFEISKVKLTLRADNKSRTYGEENPELTFSYIGLLEGDEEIDVLPTLSTEAVAGSSTGKYTITITGGEDDNYEIILENGELEVTKAELILRADNKTRSYGKENPELTFSYIGLIDGDEGIDVLPTLSTEATVNSPTGTYTITITGGEDDNYELVLENGELKVTKAELILKAENKSRAYGKENPELTFTYIGLLDGDEGIDVLPTLSTEAKVNSPVGTYAITLTGGQDDKYELKLEDGKLEVTKAELILKADNKSRVYGQENPSLTFTYIGLLNGDAGIAVLPTLTTQATVSSSAGKYPITLTGGSDTNYSLILQNGELEVSKAELILKADNKQRSYGQENPVLTFSYTGLQNGDKGIAVLPTLSTPATVSSSVGKYAITLTGGSDDNYTLILQNGELEVKKAELILKADNKQRNYGQANPPLTFSYIGLQNGDKGIAVLPTLNTSATVSSSAGKYAIILSGGSDDNYTLILQNGELEVTKAELILKADNKERSYGQANPPLTFTYNGFLNGDTGIAVPPTLSTPATVGSSVGKYAITLTGGSDNNYTLILQNGELEVSKAQLILKADNKQRSYGQENPVLTFSYTGLQNGDKGIAVLPTLTTPATVSSSVGKYAITLTGGSDDNYTLILQNGELEVSKAELILKADNKQRSYGQTNPPLTFSYIGLQNEDKGIAVLPTLNTSATVSSSVGKYSITLTGGSDVNYTLILQNGELEVTKAELILRADNKERSYGQANPPLTFTYSGFLNGDTKIAVPPTLSTQATVSSPAGKYAINFTGGSDVNYTLILQNGELEVKKAELILKADDKQRSYGQANPELTFTYSGLLNGDTGIAEPPTLSTLAAESSKVGTYAITMTGGSDDRYNLILENGKLEVTKASLTIQADNKTKAYGDDNPSLTFTYTGLANGETKIAEEPAVSTEVALMTLPGIYPIRLSGGSDTNYEIRLLNGEFTVTKPEVSEVTNLEAVSGNKSVALNWEKPELGGRILEGYRIELSQDGKEFSLIKELSESELTVENLENNRPYWFRVQGYVLDVVGKEKVIGPIVPVAIATDNSGTVPLQSAGQFKVIIEGKETEIAFETKENEFVFTIGGVKFSIGSRGESGEPLTPYEAILLLENSGQIDIEGDEFLPGSWVSVWLISNETIGTGGRKNFELPFLKTSISEKGQGWLRESKLMDTQPGAIYFLGLTEVSEDGLFNGTFDLPATIAPGIYTLQTTGISKSGEELSLSVGTAISSDHRNDEDEDGIPDLIKERTLLEVLEEVSLKVAWGNSSVITQIPTKVMTLLSGGGVEEMRVNWNLTDLDKNLFARGIYQFEGELINPEVINLSGIKAKLVLEVLPKPAPVDVILDNTRFKVGTSNSSNYFEIGKISIIDPIDDVHELILTGSDADNAFFEIKDRVLYWNSSNPAASRTEFTIKVKVTDRDGNQLEKSLLINRDRQSLEQLEVFNTFTPNRDGRNDAWGVPGTRYYKDVILQIFERSGELIFTSTDPDKKWDGTFQGKELPVGTYYWTLKIGETGQIRRGMINLLRK